MEREELQELYDNGELDDTTTLQQYRDEIHTFTGLHVPRSVAAIEDWWSDNKAVFSRQIKPSKLSEEADDEDNEEQEETEEEGDQ